MLRQFAAALATLAAAGLAYAKEEGDVQIAWLGGGRSGAAEWIVSRPGWGERERPASGGIWGFDADGERVWCISGEGMGKRIGHRLARIGDVDGDGCRDFVASSYGGLWQDAFEVSERRALKIRPLPRVEHLGSVRCFSGKDGQSLWVVWGTRVGDRFGEVVSAAGDFDGDGSADVAVGRAAPRDYAGPGGGRVGREERVDVLSGIDGALLHVFDKPWGEAGDQRFGSVIAGGSDLDADGWPELAVSAPHALAVEGVTGRVDLFRSRDRGHLAAVAPDPRKLAPYPAASGEALGFLPDLDGDGIDELFVSIVDRRVDVLDGASMRVVLQIGSPMFSGNDVYSGFGSSVAVAGDADGDDRLDLVVASRDDWVETEGERYDLALYSGCNGHQLASLALHGRKTVVAGAREAPWDVLVALPTQERVVLVRETTWRNARAGVTLERLAAVEFQLD